MITSRLAFRREVAREWPIFVGDSEIPDTVGVASWKIRRQADLSIASAVAATARGSAVSKIMASGQGKLWLVALRQPFSRSNRVAADNAAKVKLWAALENSGVALPRGGRSEVEVTRSDDVSQFGGFIEVAASELAVALEVTRRENAICVGQIGEPESHGWERLFSSLESLPNDSVALLRVAVRQIAKGLFVARSFGEFDDVLVGSEVFAENDVIDRLELVFTPADQPRFVVGVAGPVACRQERMASIGDG